ncbi:hypothetical protein FACS1894191_2130 [Clostridia bacterium]|nr:hypothetical protein FACS1894191_2130 [Clostridia bacterium]
MESIAVFSVLDGGVKLRVAEQVGQIPHDMRAQEIRTAGVRNVIAQAAGQVLILVFEAHNIYPLFLFLGAKKARKG